VQTAFKSKEERQARLEAVTEQARDVARLVHAIYHDRDREGLKRNLDLWARDDEGFA
jgi:hypothetical protein